MAEYIDKQELQNRLQKKKPGIANKRYTDGWNDAVMTFKSMVHSAPTVEVVRCKDCIKRRTIFCPMVDVNVYGVDFLEDGFCSYGERKDNG